MKPYFLNNIDLESPNITPSRRSTLATGSSPRPFEVETWCYIKHENYELQLIKKTKSKLKEKEVIPSTYQERIAFYLYYITFSHNMHFATIQFLDFNRFFWQFVINTVMKSLPMSYIYLYLASYVPNELSFVSKMVPIFYGHNFAIVSCAMFNLFALSSMLGRYMDFLQYCFKYIDPWTRCIDEFNVTGRICVQPEKFIEYYKQGKIFQHNNFSYYVDNLELTLPGTMFYRHRLDAMDFVSVTEHNFIIYVWCAWCLALVCMKQIFNKPIWKIFNVFQWSTNIILFAMSIHMLWIRFEITLPDMILPKSVSHFTFIENLDLSFVAESMTAPAMLHILSARSKRKINPGLDSAVVVGANTLYFIWKAFLLIEIEHYVEHTLGFSVVGSYGQWYPYFLFFPMYFSRFLFGPIFTFFFFISITITEITMFIIIFQCLVEIIVTEWTKLNAFLVSIVLFFIGCLQALIINTREQAVLNFYSIGITTMCETIIIIFVYPMGRLADDIYFHTGKPVSSVRSYSFRLMPIYYMIKLYFTIDSCIDYLLTRYKLAQQSGKQLQPDLRCCPWIWTIYFIPYVLGVFYIIGMIVKKKQKWNRLFQPSPMWGPAEHVERQLRKQFDSRDFAESTSSRYLARYVKAKTEKYMYKLEVCYDKFNRRASRMSLFRRPTVFYSEEKKHD